MNEQNYIDVELIIAEDIHDKLTDVQLELIKSFDIITKCEYENLDVIIYEDFSICYPPEHYNNIIEFLNSLPESTYSFKIFDDDETVIKHAGTLEVDRDDIFIFSQHYN